MPFYPTGPHSLDYFNYIKYAYDGTSRSAGWVPGKYVFVKKAARSSKKFAYAGTGRKLGLSRSSAGRLALASAMRAYVAALLIRSGRIFGKMWKKLEM